MDDACDIQPTSSLPGLDGVEQRSWEQFLGCSLNLVAELNESLMDTHNVSIRDVLLLELLNSPDRRTHRLRSLAQTLRLSTGQLDTHIRRLEGLGWITRSPTRRDRRGMLLRITGEGHMHLYAVLETYAQEVRAHYLDHLQHEHMVSLVDGCRRINGSFKVQG